MQLNELYTINRLRLPVDKSSPDRSGSKDYSNKTTLTNYMKDLEQEGFVPLGQGLYGVVFTNDVLGYAVKIFSSGDGGYLAFLRYILVNRDNPHLPVIRGRFKSINRDYTACRLELLDKIGDEEGKIVNRLLARIQTGFLKPESFIKDVRKNDAAIDRQLFSDSYLETMFDLYRYGRRNGRTLDIHAANVMKRGQTLVIVDPFT